MDAIEYLKEKGKMTNSCKNYTNCSKCKLSMDNNDIGLNCSLFEQTYPEKAIKIVEQWGKDNPKKTYLSVLLEKLPNTFLDKKGIPIKFCPDDIFGDDVWIRCEEILSPNANDCIDCWNREFSEKVKFL